MRFVLITAAVLSLAAGAGAHDHFGSSDAAGNCTPGSIRFEHGPAQMAKEVIQAADLRSIRVENAPLSVRGGSTSGYTITVCKAAESAAGLSQIQVAVKNGRLEATGPKSGRWSASFHVLAPQGADLDIVAQNGPVSVRDLEGTLLARTGNGPISLSNLKGSVDVEASNGPITLNGGSGTMKVRGTNGPLSIQLKGAAWEGGTLDAATKNGPLNLQVPSGYGSQVVVEASGRGPIACSADDCRGVRAIDDESPRRIELGRGPQNVRISTVNGPVVINDAD